MEYTFMLLPTEQVLERECAKCFDGQYELREVEVLAMAGTNAALVRVQAAVCGQCHDVVLGKDSALMVDAARKRWSAAITRAWSRPARSTAYRKSPIRALLSVHLRVAVGNAASGNA